MQPFKYGLLLSLIPEKAFFDQIQPMPSRGGKNK